MKKELNKLPKDVLIADLKISDRNKELIKRFMRDYVSGLYAGRQHKYEYALMRFAYLIEKDFDKLTEDDTVKINNILKTSDLSDRSIQDLVSEVKHFYKLMFGKGRYIPENIAGLKAPRRRKTKLKLPSEMPDEKIIYKIIKACNNPRDKFLIALMGLDGALRPIEARRMVWGDIKKDKYGYFAVVKTAKDSGDSDTRAIRIIKSEPYFIKWNTEYPSEKNDGSFVFVNYSNLEQINQGTISALFKRLKKKLKIKILYPYLLRHALLTNMSKDPRVSIPLLKKFAGHSKNTDTISEYLHFGDDDLKDMQLQINGIVKKEEKKEAERKPIKCPKCGKSNEYDAEFCNFCNMALSQKRMVESHEKLVEIDKKLKDVEERKDAMNKMLFMIAKRELASLRGKDKKEMEETINIIAEGLKE